MNDTELLEAFRERRSDEAFSELVRRYAGLVFSAASRRLSNVTLAEDITQIVFIRFAKSPPRVKNDAELAAWLHRVTVNATVDLWRSEIRRRARELQATLMQSPESEHVIWDDIAPKLDDALNQLGDCDRHIILLRFFSQKSMREVGASFGISEDAAKMRVSRAVERLRAQLGVAATASTVTALGILLTDNSVKAAPPQLDRRLGAIKPPASPPVAGIAGLFAWLLQISGPQLAAVATVATLMVVATVDVMRPRSAVSPSTIESQAGHATKPTPLFTVKDPDSFPSADAAGLVPARQTKNVRMSLRVSDSRTGEPLDGAKVTAVFFGPGGESEGYDLTTDSEGAVGIPEADDPGKNGSMNVFVDFAGYVSKSKVFPSSIPGEYAMKLDLAPPTMTVRGVVVDSQGQRVAGVKILSGQGLPDSSAVLSRDDGSWVCRNIPADASEFWFILKKSGYAPTVVNFMTTVVDLTNLVLVIDRGFTIKGFITDVLNRPVPNALIKTASGDPDYRVSTRSDQNGAFSIAVRGEYAETSSPPLQTNQDGAVVIRGLTGNGPGHGNLVVEAEGFAPQLRVLNLSIPSNICNFTLSSGKAFRGHVVNEEGTAISNAVVQVDVNKESFRTFMWLTHTGAYGEFEWETAPEEETLYWIAAAGYQDLRELPLIADGTDHEIVLKR